jgi:polar amino acid transport system substrate-binding protein
MGVAYEVTEYPLAAMLEAVQENREGRMAEVGVSCLTITAEREKFVDFSHAFHETYIGIAVKQRSTWAAVVGFLWRPAVLKALGLVVGIAGLVGGIFFLLEGRTNERLYSMDSRVGRGIEAFLVGLVFVTRGPIRFYEFKTLTARVFSAMLAVGGTLLIAGVTAVLASAFTLDGIRSQITGIADLASLRVGTLEASTSAAFLDGQGITYRAQSDLSELIEMLDRGALDAVAFDAPFLKYAIKEGRAEGRFESLAVLPYEFEPQSYGFALLEDDDLQEGVNRALLKVLKRPEWRRERLRYLGE